MSDNRGTKGIREIKYEVCPRCGGAGREAACFGSSWRHTCFLCHGDGCVVVSEYPIRYVEE